MDWTTGAGYIVKSIVALMVIILLANILLKKLNSFSGKQHGTIQVIERLPVSKSSSLAIVKIGKQVYLMSLSDNSSEILKEFTASEAKEIVMEKSSPMAMKKPAPISKLSIKDFKKQYEEAFERQK